MKPLKQFSDHPQLGTFCQWIQEGKSLVIEELWDAPLALLATLAQEITQKDLLIISAHEHEDRLFEDFPYFSARTPQEFPPWETFPSDEVPPSGDTMGRRFQLLKEIQESETPLTLFVTLPALLQKLVPPQNLNHLFLSLSIGMELSLDLLVTTLSTMGYQRVAVASDKGEFAVRGGIVDLFPLSSPLPFRIEFCGDEISSLRTYDPLGQTTIEKVGSLLITPGDEFHLLSKQKNWVTLLDYFNRDLIVIFDGIEKLEDKYVNLKDKGFLPFETLFQKMEGLQKIYLTDSPLEKLSEVHLVSRQHKKVAFEAFHQKLEAHLYRHPFFSLLPSFCPPEHEIEEFQEKDLIAVAQKTPDLQLQFVCQNGSEKERIRALIGPESPFSIEDGYLSSGFYLENPPLALVPLTEFTHRYRVRRQKQRSYVSSNTHEMMLLSPGEAVVHANSGIGKYLGIEKRPNHLGIETEFLTLEYAEGAKLYVPIDQSNLLSKYIGTTESVPELHTLGSSKWSRARERTERAIVDYAHDLLRVQAERLLRGGFAYPPDSDLVLQFGEEFPYEETPDQLNAICKVREDMESSRTMDRLILGDVGYGKTEVAMRAAFKAVVDGEKQVAVLVPTTVLAMQHFETFSARMANFPVRVAALSRFLKPKQIAAVLEEVATGQVDILIGTHRILSQDVLFKNLGLVIIDEEQRFGVKAKEHLKQLKKEVDCLTLSATPIPRTLYFSLVGAREISVINTPPEDRLPIQSMVCQGTDELIKNALLRELARDGQAFFIHNRVETIFEVSDRLRGLIPEARIVVGHGQMSAQELDTIFHQFKVGEADILVATSIIENGIDIPRANTILIDRADRFGLADLYQMRGRVGRGDRRAYCYFMVPNTRELSEISRKRLSVLAQSSGHGAGMKIAMHDLELRGAGNILGMEQSGHVTTIGFHLYCKLLKKALTALEKKEKLIWPQDVKLEIPFDARLPDDYVNETVLRMEIYQRLGDAESEEGIDQLMDEVQDRFGPLPLAAQWLAMSTKLRLFAQKRHFTQIKVQKSLLYAEQNIQAQKGAKNRLSKKLVVSLAKTPQEFLEGVKKALRDNFP